MAEQQPYSDDLHVTNPESASAVTPHSPRHAAVQGVSSQSATLTPSGASGALRDGAEAPEAQPPPGPERARSDDANRVSRPEQKATLISSWAAVFSAAVAALGLIVAAAPAYLGVLAWNEQQEQQRGADSERERRLASLVSAWSEARGVGQHHRGVVFVSNRSLDPVHDVVIQIGAIYPPNTGSIVLSLGAVPPCTRVEITSKTWLHPFATNPKPHPALVKLEKASLSVEAIGFTDQLGKKWHRKGAFGATRPGSNFTVPETDNTHGFEVRNHLGDETLPIKPLGDCQDAISPAA